MPIAECGLKKKTGSSPKLGDRIFYENLPRIRKESSRSERDAASIGGISLSPASRLGLRKAHRGAGKENFDEVTEQRRHSYEEIWAS